MASAKQSTQRAKFSYVNRSDIEKLIASGKINENDIVYTKDTHENIFIGSDLSINPVQSKIYSFQDIKSAEDYLNKATDSYAGQLVAIETNGHYSAYIVNKNGSSFYVSLVSESVESGDYNTLGNRPIDNLNGTLDTPIIVENLQTGIYKITGQYKISLNDETTYLTTNETLFFVLQGEEISIRKITSHDILSYVISENSIISETSVPTSQWIIDQGYASETYVNEKIAVLDFITRDEVNQYVKNAIDKNFDELIDKKIEKKLNESFGDVEDSDISNLF